MAKTVMSPHLVMELAFRRFYDQKIHALDLEWFKYKPYSFLTNKLEWFNEQLVDYLHEVDGLIGGELRERAEQAQLELPATYCIVREHLRKVFTPCDETNDAEIVMHIAELIIYVYYLIVPLFKDDMVWYTPGTWCVNIHLHLMSDPVLHKYLEKVVYQIPIWDELSATDRYRRRLARKDNIAKNRKFNAKVAKGMGMLAVTACVLLGVREWMRG